jgi:hypothetical protein
VVEEEMVTEKGSAAPVKEENVGKGSAAPVKGEKVTGKALAAAESGPTYPKKAKIPKLPKY